MTEKVVRLVTPELEIVFEPDPVVACDALLGKAVGKLESVCVMGWKADGTLIWDATHDVETTLFLLEKVKQELLA